MNLIKLVRAIFTFYEMHFCYIFQEASEEDKSDIAEDLKFKISILVDEF